jgi:hypothetical protein
MQAKVRILVIVSMLLAILLTVTGTATSQVGRDALKNCAEFAFSTEEDFVTQGPPPADGNPIISDGDLLGPNCTVCARNADLLQLFQVSADLGLDAADVLSVDGYVVAFSTELDDPNPEVAQFTAGDLLVTGAAPVIIQNQALTAAAFGDVAPGYDIGLDAIHFTGTLDEILAFLGTAAGTSPVDAGELKELFAAYPGVDILYSTEGTLGPVEKPTFLDGDLLSARYGTIVAGNDVLLPADVTAGIPDRGVDFGLDAVTADRLASRQRIQFSTEILYDGRISFTDGDVLLQGNGVIVPHGDLITCFEPKAGFVGLDALSINYPVGPSECVSRLTKISDVDVGDISLVDGMVKPMVVGINAPSPFGGIFPLDGTICDDVTFFRVQYRQAGSGGSWTPLEVPAARNWKVAETINPLNPPCTDKVPWSSGTDGWFDANAFRGLLNCTPTLALTVWRSGEAAPDPEGLYEVVLETQTTSGVVSDTVRLVQLDNTKPEVGLEKVAGVCDAFTAGDMPLMATGHISDTHFYEYRLVVSGDGYTPHAYPAVAYYDDLTDNVIETGTVGYPGDVDLHEFSVFDLAADPVKCGYSLSLTAWDRTVWGSFVYPFNIAHQCTTCRYTTDTWGFEYSPSLP